MDILFFQYFFFLPFQTVLQPPERKDTLQKRYRPFAGEYGDDQKHPRQQQYRSWNTDIRNHHLRQVIPMLSSQINECIFISADKDKGKKHRPPNQHGCTKQKPFQQRYPAQVHQFSSYRPQEKQDHKRRYPKPPVHQQICQDSSPHSRPVLDGPSVGQQVCQRNVFYLTLIGPSRKEERNKS